MTLDPSKHRLYERYFIDPEIGDGVLRPPRAGMACRNLRTALSALDYHVGFGDRYDDGVASTVRQFQIDSGHAMRDGFVGPGTRALLVRRLLERYGESVFQRLEAPPVRIFVSYRREDAARINQHLVALREWEFHVWYDEEIPGGARWAEVLQKNVTECDVVVVFLSKSAAESKWVFREVQFGDEQGKPILAVRLDPDLELSQLPGGWGVLLSSSQILEAAQPYFEDKLKHSLEHLGR